jgi:hypothetical protein
VFRVPKTTPRKFLASDGYPNYVENHPLVFGTVTQIWDPVESASAEPLTATTNTRSEISALFEHDDFASSSTAEQNEPKNPGHDSRFFWNQTTPLSGRLFESGNNDERLGSLNM